MEVPFGTDTTNNELVIASAAVPVYRFWSPVYTRHFYTISAAERDKLINNYPHFWTYEGVAYQGFADSSQPGTAPIYRFWSDILHAHFYTISAAERDKLINNYPTVWTYEGTAFYAYPAGAQVPGTSPVYRFWSNILGCHFYTISEAEKNKLVNDPAHVWIYEKVAWYALPAYPAAPVAVDPLVSASLGSTRYDLRTGRTSVLMTITNTSTTTIQSPLWVVIRSTSDPAVTLAGSSGVTADGYEYAEVNPLSDGRLDPGESISTWLYFDNPLRHRLNLDYSIRGVI